MGYSRDDQRSALDTIDSMTTLSAGERITLTRGILGGDEATYRSLGFLPRESRPRWNNGIADKIAAAHARRAAAIRGE